MATGLVNDIYQRLRVYEQGTSQGNASKVFSCFYRDVCTVCECLSWRLTLSTHRTVIDSNQKRTIKDLKGKGLRTGMGILKQWGV